MMRECIFCRIAHNEMPSRRVYEDDGCVAFLDINPANVGHVIVTTKQHWQTIASIPRGDLQRLIGAVQAVSIALGETLSAEGVNVLQNNGYTAGQLVPHVHFHVIPRFPGDKVVFTWERKIVPDERMSEIASSISRKISDVMARL